jgi:hypothetical protein
VKITLRGTCGDYYEIIDGRIMWKKLDIDPESETWIGDARADHLVLTPDGIVWIDMRVWDVLVAMQVSIERNTVFLCRSLRT